MRGLETLSGRYHLIELDHGYFGPTQRGLLNSSPSSPVITAQTLYKYYSKFFPCLG